MKEPKLNKRVFSILSADDLSYMQNATPNQGLWFSEVELEKRGLCCLMTQSRFDAVGADLT